MRPDESPTSLTRLLDGFFGAHVVLASTKLKVYTKCADAPQDADTLAHRCGVEPAWMTLLLDANVALGLLVGTPEGYCPSPLAAACLNEQQHGALTNAFKFALADEIPAWDQLADIVRGRTPRPDFGAEERTTATRARAYGKAGFNGHFADAMRCGDFHDVQRAVEIGNGLGPLGLAVLKQNADARLTVVDWPSYETPLKKTLRHAGYRERTTFIGGDPATATPRDGQADVALLGGVLARAPEARRLPLLHAACATVRPGGRLHMQEVVDTDATAPTAALARLRAAMLFGPDGLTPLTPERVGDLVTEAGFTNVEIAPIPDSDASCIRAVRAQ